MKCVLSQQLTVRKLLQSRVTSSGDCEVLLSTSHVCSTTSNVLLFDLSGICSSAHNISLRSC